MGTFSTNIRYSVDYCKGGVGITHSLPQRSASDVLLDERLVFDYVDFPDHETPSCLQMPRAVLSNNSVCLGIDVCAPVYRFL